MGPTHQPERGSLPPRGRTSRIDQLLAFARFAVYGAIMTSSSRKQSVGALVLAVVAALGLVLAGAQSATAHPSPPPPPSAGLGPNVLVFDPSMPQSQIQATVDAVSAQQLTNQFGPQRYALLFKPGTYGSAQRPAELPGRLLHRGRRARAEPARRRHQRHRRRLQPVRLRRLRRAEQLLAIGVQPDDQRGQPELRAVLRLLQRRVLGRLAGSADAPGAGQWPDDADGLLHRAVLRHRRLHRRLALRRQDHQRIAATVLRPQQRPQRLDQRRVEPGLLRRPERAAAVLPGRAERLRPVHDRRRPPRPAGRSPTCTSTAVAPGGSSSPPPRGTPPDRPGRPPPAPPATRCPCPASSSRRRATPSRRSTRRCPAAAICC